MSISILLTAIIIICFGAALLQATNTLFARERQHYRRHYGRDQMIVDVVVIVLYAMCVGFVALLYISAGYHPVVIYFTLTFLVAVALCMTLVYCWKHRESIDPSSVVALLVWFAVVLFLTLFSRIGGTATTQVWNTPFHGLVKAIKMQSLEPLGDFLRNILLFVPIGYLIPRINPEYLRKISFAVLGGVMLSTVIESVQLVTGLGCCDMDDIISNSLGAFIGYLLWLLVQQIQKNWRV